MKLGRTEADPTQRSTDKCALSVLKARRDLGDYDIAIEELRIARVHIFDGSHGRQVNVALLTNRFHWKKGNLRCLRQQSTLLYRRAALRDETNALCRPLCLRNRRQLVTSRSSRTISSSACFNSASIISNGRGGVYL